jgi:hypothetical protein
MTKQSIWDMAIAHQNEKRENSSSSTTLSAQHKETTLLFVGSRNVGKTTLIHRFLERQETPKPTLALEYTFGRKTNQNLAKVCIFRIKVFDIISKIDVEITGIIELVLCLLLGCLSYLGAWRWHNFYQIVGNSLICLKITLTSRCFHG